MPRALIAGWISALLLFTAVASAKDTVRWTTNYYDITGSSLSEIHQSLTRSRPWKNGASLDGLTEWQLEWRHIVIPSGNRCRCSSFTTSTTITITLPRWTPPTNASPNLKKTWNRYITALGQHEAGHGQIALTAAATQQKRVKEIGDLADCDALSRKIDGLARQIVNDFRERDAEYDRLTQHGARQGAFLPGRDSAHGRGRP